MLDIIIINTLSVCGSTLTHLPGPAAPLQSCLHTGLRQRPVLPFTRQPGQHCEPGLGHKYNHGRIIVQLDLEAFILKNCDDNYLLHIMSGR